MTRSLSSLRPKPILPRFLGLLALLAGMANAAVALSFDPAIAQTTTRTNPDSLRRHIQRLQDFQTRYAYTDSCRAAEKYVFDQFTSLGLDSVAYDTIVSEGVAIRNVIGTLRGSVDPEALVILCAHVDAISATPNLCAPGAEDNASGVAVVLEAARLLHAYKPKYTIRFIAFTGEEQGYLGSEHLANLYNTSHTRIAALLNLDMIAWPGGAFGLKILCDTLTRDLAAVETQAVQLYTSMNPELVVRIPLPSDNRPFQIRGYPCLSNIERMVHDTDAYVWYHSCGDTIAHLSMPLAAEIAKAVTASLMLFQDIPAPPRILSVDSSATNTATLRWTQNREADLAGYTVYWGTSSRHYTDSAKVAAHADSYAIPRAAGDSRLFLSLKAVDSAGNASWFAFDASVPGATQSVLRRAPTPAALRVHSSREGMEIEYTLDRAQFVHLAAYDLRGAQLQTLVDGPQEAGTHHVSWNSGKAAEAGHQGFFALRLNQTTIKIIDLR